MFLYTLSWLASLIQIFFFTVSLAAALYYLAELVEEYTVITEKIIKIILGIVSLIYIGLFIFESFPVVVIVVGLVTNGIYFIMLKDFPYISLASPVFIISVVLVFVNHYLAFKYFSEVYYSFSEVLAYFTLCLWIVPFAFFISLSASDNVLPTVSTNQGSNMDYAYVGQTTSKRQGILAVFDYLYSRLQNIWPSSSGSGKTF